MIRYRFDLHRSGVKVAELTEVESVNYGYTRNDFKRCTLIHNANNQIQEIKNNLIEGSEIRIYRQGENDSELRLIWAGEIQIVDIEEGGSGDDEGKKMFNITCEHWGKVFFTNRFITKEFWNTEESSIAWGTIDEIQSNIYGGLFTLDQVDWGVTQGSLEITGNVRDRTYNEDEVLKVLQQLADVQDAVGNPQRLRGFRLTPDLFASEYHQFSWFAEYGTTRNVTYTNPSIEKVKKIRSIAELTNQVRAKGRDGISQNVTTSDTANLDFYKLRQRIVSKTNIENTDTLLEAAQDELATRLAPATLYSIDLVDNDVFTGTYREGDLVYILYEDPEGLLSLDLQVRVYEINISFDGNNIEKASIKVADERPVTLEVTPTEKFISRMNDNRSRIVELEK